MKEIQVLYVEDDPKQRDAFEKQLLAKGFRVRSAASGKEGLRLLKKYRADVLLCDLNMPESNGVEVLTQAQQIDPNVPVIILTAHGSIDLAVETLQKGAHDFVLKPLDIRKIESTIHKALERFQLQRDFRRIESSYNILMETLPDIVYSLNTEGEFLSVSPAVETILGFQPSELIGTPAFELILPDDRERVKAQFLQAMTAGDYAVKTIEFRMVTKTGEVKPFEVNRQLIFENGKAVRQNGIARDISKRKQLEQELQRYSRDLEKIVQERTEKLEYATRQLAALNAVSNRFTQIYDEEELFNETPALLTHSLDFDRATVLIEENGGLVLKSYCLEKDPPELVEDFLRRVHDKSFTMPPHFMESFRENKTIFIPDLNADERWPRQPGQIIRTKAVVVTPIKVNKKAIGVIVGNMQYHEREMDRQDVARFEMFANMVGLALDNIRAYQSLERKVIERTKSVKKANQELRRKAKELEKGAYSLGKANVQLLAVQEEIERKNADLEQALADLSESEEKFRQLTENINEVFWLVDLKTNKTIYVSPSYQEIFGQSPEKLYGDPKHWLQSVHPEDRNQLAASMQSHGHNENEQEFRIVRSDKSISWIRSRAFPIRNSEGAVYRICGVIEDMTERKEAREALEKERNFVSAILDTAGALVVVLNPAGEIVRFNRASEQTTGYSFAEVRGKRFWDVLLIPDEVVQVRAVFDELVAGDFPNTGENYWLTKDGDRRLIAWSNTALLDSDGNVEYIIATGIDITERKQAEEKLKLYKEIFINSNDPINILDPNGEFIEQNPAHKKLNGYSDEELLGKTPAVFIGEESFASIGEKMSATGNFRGELVSHPKSGPPRDIELSAFSLHDDHGHVQYRIGFARDITERKQAEEKIATRLRYEEGLAACSRTLLDVHEGFDAIQEAIIHLLVAADVGRVYIFENFEDPNDGLCARLTHEFCAPGVKPSMDNPALQHSPYKEGLRRWQQVLAGGKPIKGITKKFPKNERDLLQSFDIRSILLLPISVSGEWYGYIGFDDVKREREWGDEDIRLLQTSAEMIGGYIEHLRAEDALRESEERFRNLVENANDIIYSLTPDGVFTYVSPNWTDLLGHEIPEVLGNSFEPFVHPDDIGRCQEFLRKVIESGQKQSGIEYRVRHKDGSWKWHSSSGSPLTDDDGQVQSYMGIAHDITEKKKFLDELERANRELREAQAQLVQSEKMASLGMLVAGIAHEINTPIGAVHSMHDTLKRAVEKLKTTLQTEYSQELQQNRGLSNPLRIIDDSNKVIESGSERVINIVRRLRSFARLDEAELKTVDIHEGLEDTLTLLQHEIKHSITIERNYSKLPPISCFPGKLNQVFLNLLVNARQAIEGQGVITLTTSIRNHHVQIEIQDSGKGIPQENLKRIFDPGFTTKGVGVGTGLGLSIVYRIIQDHHGTIEVESEIGKGTKFTIVLPMDLDRKLGSSVSSTAKEQSEVAN